MKAIVILPLLLVSITHADEFPVDLALPLIAQQDAYLKASNTDGSDQFGWSVAVSGDTAVIGARLEDSDATGVNGDGSRNWGHGTRSNYGAAYVFVRSAAGWVQQAYLKAPESLLYTELGYSVAISGDTIVVGSRFNNVACVFVRRADSWSYQATLVGSNSGIGDSFGFSVAASGDIAVVGAPWEVIEEENPGEGGTPRRSGKSGAAYVFVREGTMWREEAHLTASSSGPGIYFDEFGYSVAVSGETIVVGAHNEDSDATEINGDEENDRAEHSGAVYVFARDGGRWTREAFLKASNSQRWMHFGRSVAISGDRVVVGAPEEGIDRRDALPSGAAYVFVRREGQWEEESYLKAAVQGRNDLFGTSVGISGEIIVVGANQEDSSSAGVDGDERDNSGADSGAAYLFRRQRGAWRQDVYLKASNAQGRSSATHGDEFGWSVAISGSTILVGARNEDSAATGVDGRQDEDCNFPYDNCANTSGAAYAFEVFLSDAPEAQPACLTRCAREGDKLVLNFTAGPGVRDWLVMGSRDLESFPTDKTAASVVTEMSPGKYEAVVDVGGEPGSFFVRIESAIRD